MNTQDSVMRVFYAIEFPDSVKQYLYALQQDVRKDSRSGNFTHRDNFHLTLRFIGDTEPKDRELLKQAVDAAACRVAPFQVNLHGLGHFPRGNRHILWIGVAANPQLNELYNFLEEELAARGYSREARGYTPHITLAREAALESAFSDIAASLPTKNLIVPVRRISLMQSTRINGQLRYIPIYSIELKRTEQKSRIRLT